MRMKQCSAFVCGPNLNLMLKEEQQRLWLLFQMLLPYDRHEREREKVIIGRRMNAVKKKTVNA